MTFFKQFSVSLMALGAATAVSAANLPILPTSAEIDVDASAIATALNGYSISAVGGATYNSVDGLFSTPGATGAVSTTPGPIDFSLPDAAGLKFTKGAFDPVITLSNFSFDSATNELSGNLQVVVFGSTLINVVDQSVLVASNVITRYGDTFNGDVAPNGTPAALGLKAWDFELSESFKSYMLANYGLEPTQLTSQFGYVANMIQEVRVGAVPEPSTYALMGIGLLSVGFIARRKRAA